ncbi:MAG TPA: acyl-CoA dehydrogenase family protein [Candidatus Binataceae bacterium]|nr:acyl-CoA dehydrogenase family protein [Candidatus Binataceae bacterium]
METYIELDTHLPEQYRTLKENLHKFAREVMRPTAAALDRLADPAAAIAPGSPLWDFMKQAARLGYNKAGFPTTTGGLGLDGIGHQIYLEELGWGSADLALTLGVSSMPFAALAGTGNLELIQKYVVPFLQDRDAKYIGCWPVTEPQHGSDWVTGQLDPARSDLAGHVIARRDGDSYVISGQKSAWVSNGTIATHGLVILIADASRGSVLGRGTAFVPFDLPGVTKGKPLNKIGQRALNQGEIFFDEVRIPASFMLISPDKPAPPATGRGGGPNAMMGAVFTGVARAAFEIALDYSKQRIQGGKPISQHQLVQKRLFEMFTKVEACRLLSRAAITYNTDAAVPAMEYSIASKVFCTEAAFDVASEALQLLGGNGLSKEYPIEKLFRDARAALIEDGTNEVLSLVGANLVLTRP